MGSSPVVVNNVGTVLTTHKLSTTWFLRYADILSLLSRYSINKGLSS